MSDEPSIPGRKLMEIARDEAVRLKHDCIAPEHMLLAITDEPEGKAARLLQAFDVDVARLHRDLETVLEVGSASDDPGALPFHPAAKRVLERTLEEAAGLGHDRIGPEHLLLALLREERGDVAKILHDAGARLEAVRARVGGPLG